MGTPDSTKIRAHWSIKSQPGKIVYLAKFIENGSYYFTIHAKASKEDVEKSAAYYPSYFSVDYDDASKIAKITMIDNNEKTRMVLLRFLSSVRSQKIQVDGTSMFVHEFYDKYLK